MVRMKSLSGLVATGRDGASAMLFMITRLRSTPPRLSPIRPFATKHIREICVTGALASSLAKVHPVSESDSDSPQGARERNAAPRPVKKASAGAALGAAGPNASGEGHRIARGIVTGRPRRQSRSPESHGGLGSEATRARPGGRAKVSVHVPICHQRHRE